MQRERERGRAARKPFVMSENFSPGTSVLRNQSQAYRLRDMESTRSIPHGSCRNAGMAFKFMIKFNLVTVRSKSHAPEC